eukprot:jgi/Chrzof1/8649/Cz03g18260.t1
MEHIFGEFKPCTKNFKYMAEGRFVDAYDDLLDYITERKVQGYPKFLVCSLQQLGRREQQLVIRLQEVKDKAERRSVNLEGPAPVQDAGNRPQGLDEVRYKYVSLLMELEGLEYIKNNSVAYDNALSLKASHMLYAQAHDASRIARLRKQIERLEKQLGIHSTWQPADSEYQQARSAILKDRILDIQGRVSSLVDKLNAKRQERKDSMTTGKDVFNIQRSMRRLRHQVEQNLKCLVAQEAEVEAAAAAGNGEHAQQPAQTDDGTTHQAAQPSQQPGTEATSSDPQTSSTGAVVMIGGRYDLDSICSGTLPWGDGGSTGSFQLWLQHALTVAEQQRCSEQRVILRAKAANTVRLYEHQLQVMRYICKRAQAEACSMLQESIV